jgi:hypothetical protein
MRIARDGPIESEKKKASREQYVAALGRKGSQSPTSGARRAGAGLTG